MKGECRHGSSTRVRRLTTDNWQSMSCTADEPLCARCWAHRHGVELTDVSDPDVFSSRQLPLPIEAVTWHSGPPPQTPDPAGVLARGRAQQGSQRKQNRVPAALYRGAAVSSHSRYVFSCTNLPCMCTDLPD